MLLPQSPLRYLNPSLLLNPLLRHLQSRFPRIPTRLLLPSRSLPCSRPMLLPLSPLRRLNPSLHLLLLLRHLQSRFPRILMQLLLPSRSLPCSRPTLLLLSPLRLPNPSLLLRLPQSRSLPIQTRPCPPSRSRLSSQHSVNKSNHNGFRKFRGSRFLCARFVGRKYKIFCIGSLSKQVLSAPAVEIPSDPNAAISPEQIAALFATHGQ